MTAQITAKVGNDMPYVLDPKSRSAMIENILMIAQTAGGVKDGDGYRNGRVSWNVKVRDANFDGKVEGGLPVDPSLDAFWELAKPESLFEDACAEALHPYLAGVAKGRSAETPGGWTFTQDGRSGGWLVLDTWRGRDLAVGDPAGLTTFLSELDDVDLTHFHDGMTTFALDLTEPRKSFEASVNSIRAGYEEAWKENPTEILGEVLLNTSAKPDLDPVERRKDLEVVVRAAPSLGTDYGDVLGRAGADTMHHDAEILDVAKAVGLNRDQIVDGGNMWGHRFHGLDTAFPRPGM